MLDEYGGEITSDLLRFYGVDIRDLFTGQITPRRCLALVENLPIESATYSKRLAEGERASMGWDRNSYLLADVVDVLQSLHTTLARVNASNPKRVKDPDPYNRPGQKERDRKAKSSNPFASVLNSSTDVSFTPAGEAKSFSISPDILQRSKRSDESEGQPFTIN